MHIVIVHNAVSAASAPDEQDVLVQADAVSEALRSLGHDVETLPCNLDLASIQCRLESLDPDLVFNVVESLDGHGRLIHLFPALLDAIKLPYTGSQTEAIWMTSHKVMAKRHMLAAGIPTPVWLGPYPKDVTSALYPKPPSSADGSARNWIIKSLWEHASVGLESDSIVSKAPEKDIFGELSKCAIRLGGACFAEEYIHGREFNLSVLAGPDGTRVLPPAGIVFEGYDTSRPLIVGYRAKWKEDSYEYRHTRRRFEFDSEDESLLAVLKELALQCWQVFGLRGYARVDFRVDDTGKPWILEINANPCISPDAGFAAAANVAGIDFTQAVDRIIRDGMMHHSHFSHGVATVPPN
jgi:D-alanine-D-alanine ligase